MCTNYKKCLISTSVHSVLGHMMVSCWSSINKYLWWCITACLFVARHHEMEILPSLCSTIIIADAAAVAIAICCCISTLTFIFPLCLANSLGFPTFCTDEAILCPKYDHHHMDAASSHGHPTSSSHSEWQARLTEFRFFF